MTNPGGLFSVIKLCAIIYKKYQFKVTECNQKKKQSVL